MFFFPILHEIMSTNFFIGLLGWENDIIFKFLLVLISISTVLESKGIFVTKQIEISDEDFFFLDALLGRRVPPFASHQFATIISPAHLPLLVLLICHC